MYIFANANKLFCNITRGSLRIVNNDISIKSSFVLVIDFEEY